MAAPRRGAAGQGGVGGQVSGHFVRRPDMHEGVAAENDVDRMGAVFD